MSEDGRRLSTLGLASLLALCCVSITALIGGATAVGGAAGATAVATGASGARALVITLGVTGVTLAPIYAVWRWRGN
ncbi:hypothetical protein BRC81_12710 [Halobacteriales archaeon QS_1_68_20]|nr:MAG: hypothetical protein BRC81_12710 [Halobacteriales archaeon QS_1_68_20]